jgi:GTP-binding protein HflX
MLKEDEHEERLREVISLANTAEYEVAASFVQSTKPRARYLLGEGKVREIKEFVKANAIDLVVFENFLKSRQVMSLEGALGVPVIDRFDLILNVFELHAKSREAKLQIELARLKRKMPYIKMFLGRKVREEHPGFGGSGEFIIHSTMSAIHKRINKIEEKLETFQERVERQRERRREKGKVISLVGYTNVGKTTLLNALTKADKEVKEELFTTLRTKTSSFELNGEKIFVNDTIGFIRNLPHELVYAFRTTLGDIRNSDMILLILDASEPLREFIRKKEICENTLIEIRATNMPVFYVLNKIDKADGTREKEEILPNCVKIAAKYGTGLEELKENIARMMA